MLRRPAPAQAVRWAILAGIALLLLQPLIVTPWTVYPAMVGKALWSRSLIAVLFGLWAVLALSEPAWRPPRSRVLLLLAVGLGISLLAACFGVSVQRSLWSNYARMQGVIDLAHWFALAVVLVSVLRTPSAWRKFLALSVGVSAAAACVVVAGHLQLDLPFYTTLPEPYLPRRQGTFGNPIYLSVYLLVHLFLALGFAVRSWLSTPEPGWPGAGPTPPPATPTPPPATPTPPLATPTPPPATPPRPGARWLPRLGWLAVSAVHLYGLTLAGSVSGFLGLFAGAAALAFAGMFLGRGWVRRGAVTAVVVLGVFSVGAGLRTVDSDRSGAFALSIPNADYVTTFHLQRPGVQSRLAAWRAGLEGFAERPWLGWGPGNFGVVFGRFASGYGAVTEPHDQAHGQLVEVAATTGVAGVAAYLALWLWVFLVIWRAARAADPPDRALVLFAGAALMGGLAQSQTLFDTPGGLLQTTLLLGFVAALERTAFADARWRRAPARLRAGCAALLRRRGVRIVCGAAAIALAGSSLAAHQVILSAASFSHVPDGPHEIRKMAGGIDRFPPLANTYRWWLMSMVEAGWREIYQKDPEDARRVLAWVEREAEEALRTEPENWRFHHGLTHMYATIVGTDSSHVAKGRDAHLRAQALTPNRPVFAPLLGPPEALAARRLDDGRHELRWRVAEGAGYHVIGLMDGGDRARRFLLHSYDPSRTSFVLPGREDPDTNRYGIKACLYPGVCTDWVRWPPLLEPAGEAPRRRDGQGRQ